MTCQVHRLVIQYLTHSFWYILHTGVQGASSLRTRSCISARNPTLHIGPSVQRQSVGVEWVDIKHTHPADEP